MQTLLEGSRSLRALIEKERVEEGEAYEEEWIVCRYGYCTCNVSCRVVYSAEVGVADTA